MSDQSADTETDPASRSTPGQGVEFVVHDDTDQIASFEESSAAQPGLRPLDAARVRQLSAVRRGAYRVRSYCLVAVVACGVAGGQLALMAVRHVRALGWSLRPAGYVCGILAAMMAAAFFLRRAAELTRELRTRAPGPQATPDFSTLSNGSHAWKNLEQMREGS
jgi:hypothetical protein